MLDNIKEMLKSKKFKVLAFSIIGLVCAVLSEKMNAGVAFDMGWKAVLVWLGAQGLADFGKAGKQVEKESEGQ